MVEKKFIMNGGSNNRLNKNIEPKLLEIADTWYELSKKTERGGITCVGCKIVFYYKNIEYHMFAQSKYNEEFTFMKHILTIKELLEKTNAESIRIRVGRPIL